MKETKSGLNVDNLSTVSCNLGRSESRFGGKNSKEIVFFEFKISIIFIYLSLVLFKLDKILIIINMIILFQLDYPNIFFLQMN